MDRGNGEDWAGNLQNAKVISGFRCDFKIAR
ncbi:MAG: hypothetical protein HZRFUVUK_001948 [Candidatus Fervidibacterota bacterium]|jgi:hypothetical protein